jgi:hypothetical protein
MHGTSSYRICKKSVLRLRITDLYPVVGRHHIIDNNKKKERTGKAKVRSGGERSLKKLKKGVKKK